ncbi:MAG: four helix bundle protein [Candidatus Bipolaricaulota bacterium]|nr:MAG: four helix bundle protein [Candidatus Bipolaricaulota bacterium]
MPESIETLEVWREAIAIARDLYTVSSSWPATERFGMTSQVSSLRPREPRGGCQQRESRGDQSIRTDRSRLRLRGGYVGAPRLATWLCE